MRSCEVTFKHSFQQIIWKVLSCQVFLVFWCVFTNFENIWDFCCWQLHLGPDSAATSQGPLLSAQINRPDYCNIYFAMIWQKLQTIFNKNFQKLKRKIYWFLLAKVTMEIKTSAKTRVIFESIKSHSRLTEE